MRFFSSTRITRQLVIGVGVLLAVGLSCANNLDFESIKGECPNTSSPNAFDIPTDSDHFCAATLEAGVSYVPEDLTDGLSIAIIERVVASDEGIGYASINQSRDGFSIGLGIARLQDDGSLSEAIGFVGTEYGIHDPGSEIPLVTDLLLLDTNPVTVIGSFGDLGVLYVQWDDSGAVTRRQHLPGGSQPNALGVTAIEREEGQDPQHLRQCVLDVCVVADGAICLSHSDCGPESFCHMGVCEQRPICATSGGCSADAGLECGGNLHCAVSCERSEECPYGQQCLRNVCGGIFDCRNSDNLCEGESSCLEGRCVEECVAELNQCGGEQVCVVSNENSICGPETAVGSCSDDWDCNTAWALGLTNFEYQGGEAGIALASGWDGLRLGFHSTASGLLLGKRSKALTICTLTDQSADDCQQLSIATDVVWKDDALFVALSGSIEQVGIAVVDVGARERIAELDPGVDIRFQSILEPLTCPIGSGESIPVIQELMVIGDYLLAFEGGALGNFFSEADSRIRVFQTDSGSVDQFVREVACIPLGQTDFASVTAHADDQNIWMVGAAVTEGGGAYDTDMFVYDMGGLDSEQERSIEERLLYKVRVELDDLSPLTVIPSFSGGHAYFGTERGLGEYLLDVRANVPFDVYGSAP